MALDFIAMQTELQARGFADMTVAADVTRLKRWLNDSMHLIDETEDWPYLNASTTGAAPLTIADLRKVERVADVANANVLRQRARGEITSAYADLTTTGTPWEFYVTAGTTINVYPASTSTTLTVTYWKFGPDLSANADAPLMPDRFRMAIVEDSVAKACVDRGDYQGAQSARVARDEIVDRMRQWAGFLEPGFTFVPLAGTDC